MHKIYITIFEDWEIFDLPHGKLASCTGFPFVHISFRLSSKIRLFILFYFFAICFSFQSLQISCNKPTCVYVMMHFVSFELALTGMFWIKCSWMIQFCIIIKVYFVDNGYKKFYLYFSSCHWKHFLVILWTNGLIRHWTSSPSRMEHLPQLVM